jgi:hypothetical protein
MMRTLSWQATVLLLAVVGAVTSAFLLVFYRDGIGSALETLAVFGAVIAGIAAVIVWQLRLAAQVEGLETVLKEERTAATNARARAELASERVEAVLAHADPALIERLKQSHPTLFAP